MTSQQTLAKWYKKNLVTGEAPRRITKKYVIEQGHESLEDFYNAVEWYKNYMEEEIKNVRREKKAEYDKERYLERRRVLEESKYEKRVVRMMCYSFDTASKKQQETGITHHMYAHEITSFSKAWNPVKDFPSGKILHIDSLEGFIIPKTSRYYELLTNLQGTDYKMFPDYNDFIHRILQDDPDAAKYMLDIFYNTNFIQIISNESSTQDIIIPFKHRIVQNTATMCCDNKYLKRDIDVEGNDTLRDSIKQSMLLDLPPNTCAFQVILQSLKKSYDKHYTNLVCDPRPPMSYESLYRDFFNKESTEHTDEDVVTIELFLKWFDKNNFGCMIYDNENQYLAGCTPEKLHPAIETITKAIYWNGHLSLIDKKKEFNASSHDTVLEHPSSEFKLPNEKGKKTHPIAVASSVEEIFPLIKEQILAKNKNIEIIYNGNLALILEQFVCIEGVTPAFTTQGGSTITGVYLNHLESVKISIQSAVKIDGCIDCVIDTIDIYNQFITLESTVTKSIINKKYLSTYHPVVGKVFNWYSESVPNGRIVDENLSLDLHKYVGIDFNKHYAACLIHILTTMGFPIVHPWDTFQAYDNTPINSKFLYVVKLTKKHKNYNKERMLIYGYELLQLESMNVEYSIMSYL